MKFRADVCVVGAGPAGVTFATRMSQFGHQVILVERAPFPRPHVGEAMTPTVWDLLEVTGARSAVESLGVVHTQRARVRWIDDNEKVLDFPHGRRGFTVDRDRFDQALLQKARSAGVAVLQPVRAMSAQPISTGWRVELSDADGASTLKARFLADAGGRASPFRGPRVATTPRTIALDGLWTIRGSEHFDTQIEARPEGWYWGAHLPGHAYRAMVFVEPALLRKSAVTKAGLEDFYRTLLSATHVLDGLKGPRLQGQVLARDATSWFDAAPISRSSVKLGEAAFAIDPLSSSGVQKAIQSALAGSVAANTILREGDIEAAIGFYVDNHRRSVMQHAEWTSSFYGENLPRFGSESFWLRRAGRRSRPLRSRRGATTEYRGEAVRLAQRVRKVRVPCAVGDHVEFREALLHDGLDRPIAYIDGVDVISLIDDLPSPGVSLQSSVPTLPGIPKASRARTISLLIGCGVLVPVVPAAEGR